jgi:hypothetical protein
MAAQEVMLLMLLGHWVCICNIIFTSLAPRFIIVKTIGESS